VPELTSIQRPPEPCRRIAGPADPIIKWAGGKRNLRGQLLPLVPPGFNTFYEPFIGGGAFFLALAPRAAVLGDANGELIQLYTAVRDEPDAVMAALDAMQPYALDEAWFYAMRARLPETLSPVERAARFIYLNKTCYNGLYRVNRRGEFNVPFGRYATAPALYNRDNLRRVACLLHGAELRHGDFADVLADAGAGDFVYLDPPYVPLTPTASFTRYTRGAFGLADQERLARTVRDLDARGCRVLLSNSDTPLVRELYAGFHIDEVYAPRNINSDPRARQKIRELAVRNYQPR
jgi:DNA adenine methylase